jgi:hypothetical protein
MTPEELTHHQMLWYSIATTARFYAFTSGSGPCDIDLKWAELANLTYGHLSSLPGRDYMMPSWMGLKVRLIGCLGSAAPKSLADPLEVIDWFRGCLTVSCADARRMLAGSHGGIDQDAAASIERIREAARLVGPLRHTPEFRASPEIQQWLELFRNDAEG